MLEKQGDVCTYAELQFNPAWLGKECKRLASLRKISTSPFLLWHPLSELEVGQLQPLGRTVLARAPSPSPSWRPDTLASSSPFRSPWSSSEPDLSFPTSHLCPKIHCPWLPLPLAGCGTQIPLSYTNSSSSSPATATLLNISSPSSAPAPYQTLPFPCVRHLPTQTLA